MLGMWRSLRTLVLGVTFSVCMNSAAAININVYPPKPQAGGIVTLNVTGVSGDIRFATWYKGQSTNATDQILNFYPPSKEFHGDKYFREAKGQANGSLVIERASKDFNGYYTVQIQTTSSLQQASVELTVSGVVSIALSPLVPLLAVLLFSDLNFL